MGLRPLYLAAGHGWRVSHEERALRVQREGRAPAWYPFGRLSRVVSATDAEWNAQALLACLRAGVTVSFIDGHGNPQAHCYGVRKRESTLDQLLHVALESSEWELRYRHWHRGITRQNILRTETFLGVHLRRLDPEHAHAGFCNHHYLRTGRPFAPLIRALDGGVRAMTAARLAQDISPQWLGHPRPGFCLVAEFSSLLRWASHRTLKHADAELIDTYEPMHAAAHLLTARSEVPGALEDLIHRLELWLRSWAQ